MVAEVIKLPLAEPKKRISVIMVSYMTGPALQEAVSAVLADPDVFELILVDNGNTEPARQRLSEYVIDQDRIRLIQGHGNIGFARGCNYGALHARGDYLLFLNPDAIISVGAAMALANAGEGLTQPWITGGLLRDMFGREQRGGRRDELTPLSAVLSFTPLHKLPFFKSLHKENDPLPDAPTLMPVVSGACLMLDRASFDMLGGFDDHYFLHVEDIDICHRARKNGGDVVFVPAATVMHYGSTSFARTVDVEWWKLRGFIRYFWTYSSHWFGKCLTVLAIPFMTFAIMGRAWFIILRKALKGG